jgi:spore maturation protein CgeB
VITDRWNGIENFFEPGTEILVADNAEDIVYLLQSLKAADAKAIGSNMRKRALREHTYNLRAQQFEATVADTRALAA